MKIQDYKDWLDFLLLIFYVISITSIIYVIYQYKAPKYEIPELGIEYAYTYEDDNGEIINSSYKPARMNYYILLEDIIPIYIRSHIVLYDQKLDKAYFINDNAYPTFEKLLPESKYNIFQKNIILVIILSFIIYTCLYWIFFRKFVIDFILYHRCKRTLRFSDCAYFLTQKRWYGENNIQQIIRLTVDKYVPENFPLFTPGESMSIRKNLLLSILIYMKKNRTTRIPYSYKVQTDFKDQKELITEVCFALNDDKKFQEICDKYKLLRNEIEQNKGDLLYKGLEKNWGKVEYDFNDEYAKECVNNFLNKMFEELLGEPICSFYESKNAFFIELFLTVSNIPLNHSFVNEKMPSVHYPRLLFNLTFKQSNNEVIAQCSGCGTVKKHEFKMFYGELFSYRAYRYMMEDTLDSFLNSFQNEK